jgi:hypothetical protein
VLASDVQDAAFGLPGEPGDPDRIIHLAERFVSVQEELLDKGRLFARHEHQQ